MGQVTQEPNGLITTLRNNPGHVGVRVVCGRNAGPAQQNTVPVQRLCNIMRYLGGRAPQCIACVAEELSCVRSKDLLCAYGRCSLHGLCRTQITSRPRPEYLVQKSRFTMPGKGECLRFIVLLVSTQVDATSLALCMYMPPMVYGEQKMKVTLRTNKSRFCVQARYSSLYPHSWQVVSRQIGKNNERQLENFTLSYIYIYMYIYIYIYAC